MVTRGKGSSSAPVLPREESRVRQPSLQGSCWRIFRNVVVITRISPQKFELDVHGLLPLLPLLLLPPMLLPVQTMLLPMLLSVLPMLLSVLLLSVLLPLLPMLLSVLLLSVLRPLLPVPPLILCPVLP